MNPPNSSWRAVSLVALSLAFPALCHAAQFTVTAVNKLPLARASQTIELNAAQLAPLAVKDLATVHVKDSAGKELIAQAVDTDYDALHKSDTVIFQSDFAAGETKTFTVTTGRRQEFSKDQFKAFGRFVRERFDDFAWENDCIAHRTYGKALETWAGEQLTSSTIDIWSKRTTRMVINDWYLADHYHEDTGEGADFYSAGKTRGCGGDGLWAADQLFVSKNFVNSRVLANGPIRVMFELDYEAFDVYGTKVSETRRISLDGGSQLDHFQVTYKPEKPESGKHAALMSGLGIKKVAGEQKDFDARRGSLTLWQKMEKNAGMQGVAIVLENPAATLKGEADGKTDNLVLAICREGQSVAYWAGFAWDKAGYITSYDAWKKYVDEFAQGVVSPVEVTVAEGK